MKIDKNQKKLEKDMLIGICYGNNQNYVIQTFNVKGSRKKITIDDVLKSESGKNLLKETIKKIREENHIIMNTNIPMDILEQSCIANTII